MAIGRGSMTKEMFGNRQPGAMAAPKKAAKPAMMKSGGKIGRGDGVAIKGKTSCKMC
jgi:hypothetical protein